MLSRDLTRESVAIFTDDTRMRQFFWTRPRTFLYRCTRSDVRECCVFVKFELNLSSARFTREASGLQCKGWRSETLPCGMRWMCLPVKIDLQDLSRSLAEGSQCKNLNTTRRSGASESSSEIRSLRHEREHLTVHSRNLEIETLACQARVVPLERKLRTFLS